MAPVSPVLRLLVLVLLLPVVLPAQELQQLENCRYVATDWADGDSFRIQTPEGVEHTIRLYGVDCIELHVTGKADADRLRGQRRYFGISSAGGSPQASVSLATRYGRAAAEETARVLSRPFTVHTSYADARGDGRHARIYAFVTTADGESLPELLVRKGLARAFGVCRETPDGQHREIWRARLRDLELQAARLGRGVWEHTDWERLPAERQLQREEDAEAEIATRRTAGPLPSDPLNVNTAARDELMTIPGIGEVIANRIIGGRPYSSLDDLRNVDGIGPARMEKLRPFLTAGPTETR